MLRLVLTSMLMEMVTVTFTSITLVSYTAVIETGSSPWGRAI
jgi:hypothetical protein